ncbi:MAG: hypothetical protein Kow0092_15800 [Deferrisomatales bacterium]
MGLRWSGRYLVVGLALSLAWGTPEDARGALHVLRGDGTLAIVDDASSDGVVSWQLDLGGGALVEHIFQEWFWYRVGPDGRERSIDRLPLESVATPDPGTLILSYGTDAFGLDLTFELRGAGAGSAVAQLAETVTIRSRTGEPLDLHLFELSDFDISETSGDDTVVLAEGVARQTDGSGTALVETVLSPEPDAHGLGFFGQPSDLFDQLEDLAPTQLDGTSQGTGDIHYAFQWDLLVPASGAVTVRKVKHLGPEGVVPPGVAKSHLDECVNAGETLTYSLCVDNGANSVPVSQGVLVDLLPEGLQFVEATGQGGYDPDSGTVTWPVGPLEAGAGPRCETLTVQAVGAPGATAVNRAWVQAPDAPAAQVADPTRICERVNRPPQTGDDAYAVESGGRLEVSAADGVLANDMDPDGDPLTALLATDVGHGTLTLAPDGSFVYEPNAGFLGSDGFTYRASDGSAESPPAQVTIRVERRACDVTANGFVDRGDIGFILFSRRTQDPAADVDGDGRVTVRDARLCVFRCDLPGCARADGAAPRTRAQAAR